MTDRIAVQTADFDLAEEYDRLRQGAAHGAVVTFTGLVRDLPGGGLQALELEHYPAMTERALTQIVTRARKRWTLGPVTVIHRVGCLACHEQIVLVGVASTHRQAAFEATAFVMDYLKTRAPFWKKEWTDQGTHWVDAREKDAVAVKKWEQPS